MYTSQQSKRESAPPTVNEAPLQRQQSLATLAPCPMSTPGAELADASGVVLQPERGHSVFSRCLQWLHLGHDGASVLAVVETCISQFLLQAHARVFGDLKHNKRDHSWAKQFPSNYLTRDHSWAQQFPSNWGLFLGTAISI